MFTLKDIGRFSVFYKSADASKPPSTESRPWPFSPIPPDPRGHIGQPGTFRYGVDCMTLGFQSAQSVWKILQGMYPR